MGTGTTVLFDLEDTLVQTPWSDPQHVVEFRHRTRQKLVDLGVPSIVLARIERATIMRNNASEYVEQKFSKAETQRFNLEMEKFLCRYEQDSAEKSRLFPDAVPGLKRLRRLGIRMGLITNTSAKAVNTVFQMYSLEPYFDVVITRECVKRLKPDPEGILLAVKQLGGNKFFMVGDLAVDVLAAKTARALAILVRRRGKSDSQDLFKGLPYEVLEKARSALDGKSDLSPDYVIQSLDELPAIVHR
jgi:HAD superfamily hydrolase (TIGR01549 family)